LAHARAVQEAGKRHAFAATLGCSRRAFVAMFLHEHEPV
jgi:hypothetical protein